MSPPAAAPSLNCWKARSCRASWPWRNGPRRIKMTERQPFIAGNWKMHKTLAEARTLARDIRDGAAPGRRAEVALAPPYTALATVAQELAAVSYTHLTLPTILRV